MAKVFRVHQGFEVVTLMGIECLTRLEQAFQTLMHEGFLVISTHASSSLVDDLAVPGLENPHERSDPVDRWPQKDRLPIDVESRCARCGKVKIFPDP